MSPTPLPGLLDDPIGALLVAQDTQLADRWRAALESHGFSVEQRAATRSADGPDGPAASLIVLCADGTGDLGWVADVLDAWAGRDPSHGTTALVLLADEQHAASYRRGVDLVLPRSSEPALAVPLLLGLARHARRTRAQAAALLTRIEETSWTYEQLEYLVHDLKNPLGIILTNLTVLREKLDLPLVDKLAGDSVRAARRLERLILNLLDLGRLEAGDLDLHRIDVLLEDLVDEGVAAARGGALARQLTIDVRLGAAGAAVIAVDFDLMTRVLVNLLDNAIRHSPEGCRIVVAAERAEDGLTLSVVDEGEGVPEAWRELIFERFVQRDAKDPRRAGRGLGLAFARLVAEAHGWTIGVEPGASAGSRFFLHIPSRRDAPPPGALAV